MTGLEMQVQMIEQYGTKKEINELDDAIGKIGGLYRTIKNGPKKEPKKAKRRPAKFKLLPQSD